MKRVALLLVLFAALIEAQICRISAAGLNRNRKVMGSVHAECPPGLHTPPFGNWGVTSNFGQKQDDNQFQGWCHDTRVCDNNGFCSVQCRDGWYEWNSCTDIALYAAPNCTLYNDANCTAQATATGINVHGTRTMDVPVRCPTDTDGDGVSDQGGCADAAVYRSGTNFMSLYELDPGTADELVQTLYFPEVVMQLQCDPWGCFPKGSDWLAPTAYDSPVSPPKVFAEFAALVNYGLFMDTTRGCKAVAPAPAVVSAASYQGPAVAPDSIATLLGRGLATSSGSASGTLPQELAGTRVTITDALGASRPASLSYVSAEQVNLVVPAASALGSAQLTVSRTDSVLAQASFRIENVAPALFSANASGSGVAAATAVRVADGGLQAAVPVFQCSGPGSCVAAPMDLGGPDDRLYVSLYGTGIRRASNSVSAWVGGFQTQVQYAGAQGQYPGLDQVNVLIPPAVRGAGVVEIRIEVAGVAGNPLLIEVQ